VPDRYAFHKLNGPESTPWPKNVIYMFFMNNAVNNRPILVMFGKHNSTEISFRSNARDLHFTRFSGRLAILCVVDRIKITYVKFLQNYLYKKIVVFD